MARGILRLSIQSIQVTTNGEISGQAPQGGVSNQLTATLKYPRSGAPSVVSTFPLDLQPNVGQTFDVGDFWNSGIFKEEIDTETILKVEVQHSDKPSTFIKVIAALAGAISAECSTASLGASQAASWETLPSCRPTT